MKKLVKRALSHLGLQNTFLYWALSNRQYLKKTILGMRGVYPRYCPICNYKGFFTAVGNPLRFDARCPQCHSLERHRLFCILNGKHGILNGIGSILHFAPAPALKNYLLQIVPEYISADLYKSNVSRKENIENISMENDSIDAVFCSHVLEHVDDNRAMAEVRRILRSDGLFIIMVPICEGCDNTYENAAVFTPEQRELHFGQSDHVRYYGRDFAKRLEQAGFIVNAYTASPEDTLKYGLIRGEKVFVCRKPKKIKMCV